jgi:predicted mannosyl-3-phosphoglycerate phosphatase (HAD superfamily)
MANHPVPVIAFVDLDSAPQPAIAQPGRLAGVLERLASDRITLVFCSHGSRAEVETVRQTFGVYHPFVCENGAAAFVPGRYFGSDPENTRVVGGYHAIEFARSHERVVETLRRVADRLSLEVLCFSDMSVEQVARERGLPLLEARLAKLREYSEVFRLLSPNPVAERRLIKALESAGLTCVPRGGFHHAGSVPGAGAAISVLTTLYRVAFGAILTARLGDGPSGADLAGGADLRIPSPAAAAPAAEPVEWLERIVQHVNITRDARLSWPQAARHAR